MSAGVIYFFFPDIGGIYATPWISMCGIVGQVAELDAAFGIPSAETELYTPTMVSIGSVPDSIWQLNTPSVSFVGYVASAETIGRVSDWAIVGFVPDAMAAGFCPVATITGSVSEELESGNAWSVVATGLAGGTC